VHDSLFERLGTRLFEATNEEQMQSLVVAEIGALMDARETALSPEERQTLVQGHRPRRHGPRPDRAVPRRPHRQRGHGQRQQQIYVERAGVIERTDVRFISEDHLRRVIERIVSSVGRRIDESSPMVDARLADGSRVNVIVPPLSLDGSILTIRKFAKDPFTVHDLIAMGTFTDQVASCSPPRSRAA
jgi:pilus assembly protein CpaF